MENTNQVKILEKALEILIDRYYCTFKEDREEGISYEEKLEFDRRAKSRMMDEFISKAKDQLGETNGIS